MAEKKNKLLKGPVHFFDKIIKPLKMENELRLASIIHAYKLRTVSNLKSLKGHLVQLITEFYLIAEEWSEHEKQVITDQADKETILSARREGEWKMFFPQCKQRTEFPIIV